MGCRQLPRAEIGAGQKDRARPETGKERRRSRERRAPERRQAQGRTAPQGGGGSDPFLTPERSSRRPLTGVRTPRAIPKRLTALGSGSYDERQARFDAAMPECTPRDVMCAIENWKDASRSSYPRQRRGRRQRRPSTPSRLFRRPGPHRCLLRIRNSANAKLWTLA